MTSSRTETDRLVKILVFDTKAKKDELKTLVESLRVKFDIIFQEDGVIPDTYILRDDHSWGWEPNPYNTGRVRVVGNQIWVGSGHSVKIENLLQEKRIPYVSQRTELDVQKLCCQDATPLRLKKHGEAGTYTGVYNP